MSNPMTALIIMDGFGLRKEAAGNAVLRAGADNICAYQRAYPHTQLGASGLSVGLPDGQMGNSEVGHLNIGAGRVVYQELTRITKSITDGDFFENPAFLAACDQAKAHNGKLHLMGLVSDGGVHSHMEHLKALIRLAKHQGLSQVYVHAFMDGRDVPPSSGKGFLLELEAYMNEIGFGCIATVSGRYYAMDRDNRWERVQKAYDALLEGIGNQAESAEAAMQHSYDSGVVDEFVEPVCIMREGKPTATVESGDSIVFFNFRPDRARELTRAITEPDFHGFEKKSGPKKVFFVTLTQYDATFQHVQVAYKPQSLVNTFGEVLAARGKTQLRIAETEKYAHVTFFFNGGVEAPNPGEDRALIPSPKVATYDLKPEMSAYEVTDEAVARIHSGKYDVMILNFANCDMVGHTGIYDAATEAVRTVDECVYRVVEAIRANGGTCLITADHGNAELMVDETNGEPFTAHTTNPVPLILVDDARKDIKIRDDGILADIVPTMMQIMGMEQPEEMTGKTLIL